MRSQFYGQSQRAICKTDLKVKQTEIEDIKKVFINSINTSDMKFYRYFVSLLAEDRSLTQCHKPHRVIQIPILRNPLFLYS